MTTIAGVGVVKFKQAKYFTRPSFPRPIQVIVFHDMEYPERPTGAEWCADYFAGPNSPEASAHYYVDNNSVVQGVRDPYIAWAAPGCNHNGIQIEHAGYAAQSRAEWLDDYSRAELRKSAALVAFLCNRYRLPMRWLSVAELAAGRRGIVGHNTVNAVYHRSNHSDPGPNFPKDVYIRMVREAAK